jgi:transforming growth factor-beta-induced protein
LPDFSTLCAAVGIAGLGGALSDGNWTVFAPTNEAFAALDIESIIPDVGLVTEILLYHTIDGEIVLASDLSCELEANPVEMTNGVDSFTICVDGVPTYQAGESNIESMLPQIVAADVPACNGVIHVINNVMLFNVTME